MKLAKVTEAAILEFFDQASPLVRAGKGYLTLAELSFNVYITWGKQPGEGAPNFVRVDLHIPHATQVDLDRITRKLAERIHRDFSLSVPPSYGKRDTEIELTWTVPA